MSTKPYDPNLYTIVIAGIPFPPSGYAEDTFIKVARDSPVYTDQVGADGKVTRVRMHDDRATCTFSLMQTSELNAILSALHLSDTNSDNGAGVGPFMLKDRNGLTVHESDSCWVQAPPDVELGKAATARDWSIRIANIESFEGGN